MIAIIPARGGSKGIPKKNIRPLAGKPLIFWTIEAAFESSYIDRVILSTDDEEIAELCQDTGIDLPFLRPKELATDYSLAIDVYLYTIDRLNKEYGCCYSDFVALLPTTPLRRVSDIDKAISLFKEKDADSVITVCRAQHPPEWCFNIESNGRIKRNTMTDPEKIMLNRQESKISYVPNGAVFACKISLIKRKNSFYSSKSFALVMPPERSVDIDSDFDFHFAEYLINKNLQQ